MTSLVRHRKLWLGVLVFASLTVFTFINASQHITGRLPVSDESTYFQMALSLVNDGYYGIGDKPSMLREPLFPTTIALGILIYAQEVLVQDKRLSGEDIFPIIDKVKRINIWIIWGIGLLVCVTMMQLTGNALLGCLGWFLAVSAAPVVNNVDYFMRENLTALLMLAVSACIFAMRRHGAKKWLVVLFSLLCACTSLVQGAFFYFLPFGLLMVWFAAQPSSTLSLNRVARVTLFGMFFFAAVSPWMVRNKLLFNRWAITSAAGIPMYGRAAHNDATWQQWRQMFLIFGAHDLGNMSAIERTNIEKRDTVAYTFMINSNFAHLRHDQPLMDRMLLDAAMADFASRPLKHLSMIPPLIYRGLSMEFRFGYWLFAGTLLSFLLMLYRRHWTLLAFFVPALYLFLIYPMCTYMMPRFYFPLLPYTVIANLMLVSVVVTKGMQKSR